MPQNVNPPKGLLPRPISPQTLETIGRMPCVLPPEGFDPQGTWRCAWSIHTIHGYADRDIGEAGSLRITRRGETGEVVLEIVQDIQLLAGMSQSLTGLCRLRPGAVPAVAEYELTSTIRQDGEPVADLCGQFRGRVDKGQWVHEHNGRTVRRSQAALLSADWALLAEGASVAPESAPEPFDVLDNLTVRKLGQAIRRREDLDEPIGDGRRLRCWTRMGQATLPVETFVSPAGLVSLVTAANKWWALERVEVLR